MPQGDIAEALDAFRTVPSAAARDRLSAFVRERMVRAARHAGVPATDAEDEVQEKVLGVVDALTSGKKIGSPNTYVWRAGANAGSDWHRKQSRGIQGRTTVGIDGSHDVASDESDREHAEMLQERLAMIRRVLQDPKMPAEQRYVFEQHYLEGVAIDLLAHEELETNATTKTGAPRTLQQARATIDKRLERARLWVRARIHTRERRS